MLLVSKIEKSFSIDLSSLKFNDVSQGKQSNFVITEEQHNVLSTGLAQIFNDPEVLELIEDLLLEIESNVIKTKEGKYKDKDDLQNEDIEKIKNILLNPKYKPLKTFTETFQYKAFHLMNNQKLKEGEEENIEKIFLMAEKWHEGQKKLK